MTPLQQKYYDYLRSLTHIKDIELNATTIDYFDGFTGQKEQYTCLFKITHDNGIIEHIEVLLASEQKPLTKYLYAQYNIENWRMINQHELKELNESDNKTPLWW